MMDYVYFRYAERKFARDGINIKLRHHVEKVGDVSRFAPENQKVTKTF